MKKLIILAVVITLMIIGSSYEYIQNYIQSLIPNIDLEFKQEEVKTDLALKKYYQDIIQKAKYVKITEEEKEGWIEKLLDQADKKIKEALDYDDYYLHDYKGDKVIGLHQQDSIKDDDMPVYSDANNLESNYSILNEQNLSILNHRLLGDSESLYLEQITKPLPFIQDYKRMKQVETDGRKVWIDITAMRQYQDYKLSNFDFNNTYVYEYIPKKSNTKYYKSDDTKSQVFIEEFELEDNPRVNQFGREITQELKRVVYQVDTKGEPILSQAYDINLQPIESDIKPKKSLLPVKFSDQNGNIQTLSFVYYNPNTKKTPIVKVNEYELEQMLRDNESVALANEESIYATGQVGYGLFLKYNSTYYTRIRNEYIKTKEAESLMNPKDFDYSESFNKQLYDYDMENNIFKLNAKPEEFRWYIKNGRLVDSMKTDVDEEFAWNYDLNSVSYKNGELVPAMINSVKDFGLAPISTYYSAFEYKFLEGLSYDEQINEEKVKEALKETFFTIDDFYKGTIPSQLFNKEQFIDKEKTAYLQRILDKYAGNTEALLPHIDKDLNFLGDDEFTNKEWNKAIKVIMPEASGVDTFFSGATLKDQLADPVKYYVASALKLKTDIADWSPLGLLKNAYNASTYTIKTEIPVNNVNLSKYSHNEQAAAYQNLINSQGNIKITGSDMVNQIYLLNEVVSPYGQIIHTYKEEKIYHSSAYQNRGTIDVIEYDRHFVFNGFKVILEVEDRVISTNSDGALKEVLVKNEIDITSNINQENIGTVFYQTTAPTGEVDWTDQGILYLTNGVKNNDFKNPINVYVPEVSADVLSQYENENRAIMGLKFIPIIQDNTGNGSFANIDKVLNAAYFTVKPVYQNAYISGENYLVWQTNMHFQDEATYLYNQKVEENDFYLDNIYSYIKNFEADIPKQALVDLEAVSRTELIYTNVVNAIPERKKPRYQYEVYTKQIENIISQPDFKKAFTSVGLDQSNDNDVIIKIILALFSEEIELEDDDRIGYFNIYFKEGQNSASTQGHFNQEVNRDEMLLSEDINAKFNALDFQVKRFGNLLIEHKDINKAIFAFHIPEGTSQYLFNNFQSAYTNIDRSRLIEYIKVYDQIEVDDIFPDIVQKVMAYQDEETNKLIVGNQHNLWDRVVNTTSEMANTISNASDVLFSSLFGDDYNSKRNNGSIYYQNHKSEAEAIQILASLADKLPDEKISILDVFHINEFLTISLGDGNFIQTPMTPDQLAAFFLNADSSVQSIVSNYTQTNSKAVNSQAQMQEIAKKLQSIPKGQGDWTREEMFKFASLMMNNSYHWGGTPPVGKETSYIGKYIYVGAPGHKTSGSTVLGNVDCSGLIDYVLRKGGGVKGFPRGATDQYNFTKHNSIQLQQMKLMDLAYQHQGSRMVHTGFFVGFNQDGKPLYLHSGGAYGKVHISIYSSFRFYTKNPYFQ